MYQNPGSKLVDRFEDWWRRDNKGLPLMELTAHRSNAVWNVKAPDSIAERYLDPEYLIARDREGIRNTVFYADSYAHLGANIGPGSVALYLGSEPRFSESTVWFDPCEKMPPLTFDPENKWWQRHLTMIRRIREDAGSDYLVDTPDLIENIDILAAIRGPMDTLYAIMDEPEEIDRQIAAIEDTYFKYYDAMYDIVRDENGVAGYTAFGILGRGRVAKVQCDFSAMISPDQYRRFVLPYLKKQTKKLDHSLYHLDGPDAIKHVPAIMEIEDLDALQWTCGAGQPDGAYPGWYPIYDQVAAAGKGLWVQLYDGGPDDWIRGAEQLMDRYGTKIFYFHFPSVGEADAEKIMNRAEKHWIG